MKRKCLAVVLSVMLLSLSACAAGDQEESPFLISSEIGSGAGSSASGIGAGSSVTGSGTENAASGSGAGNALSGVGTGSSAFGAGAGGSMAGSGAGSPASGSGAGNAASATGAGSPTVGTNAAADGYRSIYRQIVTDSDEYTMFSLIYLNDDDIPELAAVGGDESYSIYTVRDGAAYCMVDSLYTVELTYFERSSIVVTFSRWDGGGDEGGYGRDYYRVSESGTIENGSIPSLSYSYNAVYDENGAYTGEGVTKYFYEEREIDEAAYLEMAKNMGITEAKDRLCMENAVRREEMLGQL